MGKKASNSLAQSVTLGHFRQMGKTKNFAEEAAASLAQFDDLINQEQDIRLIVLVGAGLIERYCEELIARRLPGLTNKLRERLFSRVLQNAAARYDMMEALGIAEAGVAADLRIINRVRNRFAHYPSAKNCDDEVVARLVEKLGAWREQQDPKPSSLREALEVSLHAICIILVARLRSLRESG